MKEKEEAEEKNGKNSRKWAVRICCKKSGGHCVVLEFLMVQYEEKSMCREKKGI